MFDLVTHSTHKFSKKMLKHCSPSSVDLRRQSRRNLMSIIDNNAGGAGADEDCDTSTSSADMFKHVIG